MKRAIVVEIIACLFIMLFVYAGLTKLVDYKTFSVQVGLSPLLTGLESILAPAVIFLEFGLVILLAFPSTRLSGLFGALAMMTIFTAYIFAILTYSTFIPCSCGGVLQKLGWTEHLIFNGVFVLLAIAAILLHQPEKLPLTNPKAA